MGARQGRQRPPGEPGHGRGSPTRPRSRAATITRRCAAICYAHRLAHLEPPTNSEHVRATLRGIRRTVGAAPVRKVPVPAEAARAMALSAPEGLQGTRDRALLLLGFAGAFRRSELVALDVADLVEETEDASRSPSAGRRPIRKATASRSPSLAASRLAPSRPSRRGCWPPATARARYSGPWRRAAGSARSGSPTRACAIW
jgi:integrase